MKVSLTVALSVLALQITGASAARADSLTDRIRREGVLRCAATERPGYAEIEADVPKGRAADLCRDIAATVLGKGGRFALRLLDLDSDFDRVRNGEIELVFLEPRTVAEQELGDVLAAVAPAYQDSFAVMVAQGAGISSLAGLTGRTICFMIGDPVWPLLDATLKSRAVPFRPFGFSEEVEMKDAYNVGRCDAMAGVSSTLDELRADEGVNHLRSALIDEKLGPDPVVAMVPAGYPDWETRVKDVLVRDAAR